jgi:hypothetical protein
MSAYKKIGDAMTSNDLVKCRPVVLEGDNGSAKCQNVDRTKTIHLGRVKPFARTKTLPKFEIA